MSTPSRFKAETKYGKSQEKKANRNLPMMARVGNGDGATVDTGRDNFYWIRLVNDDSRLTQCYSLVPLGYDDYIYVRRARDRDLSYYEFDKFIQDGAGGTAPPVQVHNLLGPGHDDTATDAPTQGSLIVGSAVPDWDEFVIGLAHQILKVNAGATDPIWAAFDWDDISSAAAADMIHDHHNDANGGDALNPETISSRCYVVGPSCPNTTLAAAVTDVNNDGPPESGTEYVIFVLGRTTETGDVNIPNYCHVMGIGEGVVVNMQGNLLDLYETSSLTHLTVTGTSGTAVVRFLLKHDRQIIRDCHIENTGTGAGVYADQINGTAYIYDSTIIGDNDGVYVTSTPTEPSTLYINDCRVSGDTDGLHIAAADCTVYTEYCTLAGGTNDVNLAAGTWYHIKCNWDANNSTLVGTETPLPDGPVEILSTAIRGHDSLYPDLGTTTLAQKLGDVYLARCYDIYPDHDEYGLWTRMVNFGVTCPDEHWHQGADELVWTGWAAYVGYATPNSIAHTNSQKRVMHNAATHAFYYRAASTGDDIYLRQGVSLRMGSANTVHAGIMIDDGVDAADGNGANNYYRVMVEGTTLTTNWNIRREYRVGGGAPAAAVTAYSLQPGDFYCPVIVAKPNPNWANWWAGMYYRRSNAYESLVQFDNPPFTWTPARVGLYYYISAANAGHGLWDWYDEDTS